MNTIFQNLGGSLLSQLTSSFSTSQEDEKTIPSSSSSLRQMVGRLLVSSADADADSDPAVVARWLSGVPRVSRRARLAAFGARTRRGARSRGGVLVSVEKGRITGVRAREVKEEEDDDDEEDGQT